jgi:lysozyme family protein
MNAIFDKTYGATVKIEGGYVHDPADSGGETYRGISRRAWPDWPGWPRIDASKALVVQPLAALGGVLAADAELQALVKEFYRAHFWNALRCHEVAALSVDVAVEVFDTAVNAGSRRAVVILQRCLNALNRRGADYPDLAADGDLGPVTLEALRRYLLRRALDGESVLLKMQNCLQGAHYVALAEAREKDEAFVYGWFMHRIKL